MKQVEKNKGFRKRIFSIFFNFFHIFSNKKGFTLAELLIASVILSILLLTGANVYTNFFNSVRNIRAANVVYEEARFTMERIVSEVRLGSVDYEEYYNQANNFFGPGVNETYGDNYCQYSRQFYAPGPDSEFGTFDDVPTGIRDPETQPPIANRIQDKLYLIDVSGTRRTYIKRIETTDTYDNTIGKVAMLKLDGKDWGIDSIDSKDTDNNNCIRDGGEGDKLIDTWVCAEGFTCFNEPTTCAAVGGGTDNPDRIIVRDDPDDFSNSSFLDITPESLDVIDVQFFVTPQDDPRKAYRDPLVQIQPHVTIKLIARANPTLASQFRGNSPGITIESTISARAQSEIVTECNLQECIETSQKACPKIGNVCGGAMQTCTGSVWPGCSDDVYTTHSNTQNGIDTDTTFAGDSGGGRTFYESGTEFTSCGGGDVFECKTRRCTDGFDNDCDGLTDENDPDCLFFLCNNGAHDPQIGEVCIDVGGQCQNFRPLQPVETTCNDGYDNNCNYIDYSGVDFGDLTAEEQTTITDDTVYNDPNYPDSEKWKWNIALGQGADEYDQNCIDTMCNNPPNPITGLGDINLGNFEWDGLSTRIDYLKGKTYAVGDMDEICPNIGGLCTRATAERRLVDNEGTFDDGGLQTPGYLCYDGLDNDCDYDYDPENPQPGTGADELDDDCHGPLCINQSQDCGLIDTALIGTDDFTFNFIVNYTDSTCSDLSATDLDEECEDAGGICGTVHGTEEIDNATCIDGKDNNCNGFFDGDQGSLSDPGCCPDSDNDGFYDTSNTLCEANDKLANVAPDFAPFGLIDCNDADPAIKPETGGQLTVEVCDNARYPAGHPMEDAPIDNNCSAINEFYGALPDDGLDSSDPACCVDLDGDGFGLETAYLYNKAGSCSNNSGTLDGNFDCDDFNDDVNPDATENSVAECTNGIDENCNDRTDHIDMFSDNPGGIALAFVEQTYEAACCNVAALEICLDGNSLQGDGSNSDENCNGLEGPDDHFCTYSTNRRFNNNFTDTGQGYMSSFSGVFYDSSDPGTIVLPAASPSGTATSARTPLLSSPGCGNINSASISSNHTLPASGEIEYELSNDGGATWCGDDDCAGDTITSGELFSENTATFPGAGNDLVWRATLSASGESVILDAITLNFTCN